MNPVFLILSWQGAVQYRENLERSTKYEAARAYAKQRGKPLLVVGGPLGSPVNALLGMGNHGYGDVCMDLSPSACQGGAQGDVRIADVRRIPYGDQTFGAAFVSHVLEHLPTVADAQQALAELSRVAEAVYVCSPSKQSLRGWFHSEHHLWVSQRADGAIELEQR